MTDLVLVLFAICQVLFFGSMATVLWMRSLSVNLVPAERGGDVPEDAPEIVLLYPVLRELEETMRTNFHGLAKADYPESKLRIIAIPNEDDYVTIEALRRLQSEFGFLEILSIPPTTDESWSIVWSAWQANQKAYWWHRGSHRQQSALPPKKTRQMVYALYLLAESTSPGALLSYIDADSVVPESYFRTAATGIRQFDVLQFTNVAGNLLQTRATSMFAMDHMSWDGSLYPHMSANGRQPFWVLGKGLFFRFSDLIAAGGFNPWLTIEDPEVGMRLWKNGCRLGIVRDPLIEEVPTTFGQGITQRKRWIAGFFQSLASPLRRIGMTPWERFRARLNFVPCLSLLVNPLGMATGIWAFVQALTSESQFLATWLIVLSVVNISLAVVFLALGQIQAWRQSALVLSNRRSRLHFMVRVNPVSLMLYWLYWSVPMVIGLWMFLRDTGLAWERTEKIDANHELIRGEAGTALGPRRLAAAPSAPAVEPSVSHPQLNGDSYGSEQNPPPPEAPAPRTVVTAAVAEQRLQAAEQRLQAAALRLKVAEQRESDALARARLPQIGLLAETLCDRDLVRELEQTEHRIGETARALHDAHMRLVQIESQADEAEARAAQAAGLAALCKREAARERRLEEMMSRISNAEQRAGEAEARARETIYKVAA